MFHSKILSKPSKHVQEYATLGRENDNYGGKPSNDHPVLVTSDTFPLVAYCPSEK